MPFYLPMNDLGRVVSIILNCTCGRVFLYHKRGWEETFPAVKYLILLPPSCKPEVKSQQNEQSAEQNEELLPQCWQWSLASQNHHPTLGFVGHSCQWLEPSAQCWGTIPTGTLANQLLWADCSGLLCLSIEVKTKQCEAFTTLMALWDSIYFVLIKDFMEFLKIVWLQTLQY
jgi:hypothetical protein